MLYVNWSVKHLKFAPKWLISCFLPILVAIFATFATAIVELIQLLHFGYCSNMPIRTNKLKPFLYFSLIGGPKKPVNARGSLNIHNLYSNFLKFRTFLFLFSDYMWVINASIHQVLVRIADREGPDQTATSEAV